jgi:hypothetical protein
MFDDKYKIGLLDGITLPELEVLYWKLEDSLSDGDKKKAKIFFDMFCYIGKHKKTLLKNGLKPAYIRRLTKIPYELYGSSIPSEQTPITELNEIGPTDIMFTKEKEINDFIYKTPNILCDAFKKRGKIIGREVEIEGFKCDIVFETQETLYAVELKKVQADHKAVSQLDKYCYYFYRRLRYNFFKDVKGACIANGFCKWSINEFRRKGHHIFIMIPLENGIKLREIT